MDCLVDERKALIGMPFPDQALPFRAVPQGDQPFNLRGELRIGTALNKASLHLCGLRSLARIEAEINEGHDRSFLVGVDGEALLKGGDPKRHVLTRERVGSRQVGEGER